LTDLVEYPEETTLTEYKSALCRSTRKLILRLSLSSTS
jgi:hypothetical protein